VTHILTNYMNIKHNKVWRKGWQFTHTQTKTLQ